MSNIHLTFTDIAYASIMALLLTWIVEGVSKSFKLLFKPVEFDYPEHDVKKIMQKCYNLFPKDIIPFNGEVFKRGMIVRVITSQRKVIEGELIGLNNDDMLCLMTSRYVVAHDLRNIEEITLIDERR